MTNGNEKIVIYIDMDDTLCDYKSAFEKALQNNPGIQYPQSVPGFFLSLEPLQNAVETFRWFFEEPQFDVYILTAPSPKNPHSYTEKRLWVERYLGYGAVEKLIISPHKQLSRGDYLIDDCDKGKGQERFEGRLIRFGHDQFKSWSSVREYFEQLLRVGLYVPNMSQMHPEILCFRAFDMRDRFPEPVATFREALQLIQSDRAYLPEWDSKIICYLRSGQTIPIPKEFYLCNVRRFSSRDEAETWIVERSEEIKVQPKFDQELLITDPNLPLEEQINQAFAHHETEVIDSSENDRVCDELDRWLSAAIDDLPTKTTNTAEDTLVRFTY